MAGDAVKFLKKGLDNEGLKSLKSDGIRWRWWKLYCLSDTDVFPGLLARKLVPFNDTDIIGRVYQSHEFNGSTDRITLWRAEKAALIDAQLLKSAVVDGKEYLWHVDYHFDQDKWSRKGTQLSDRFYDEFESLNEHEKALFILLLNKFSPKEVDLSVFGIPEFVPQLDAYVNNRFPLFIGPRVTPGNEALKVLTDRVAQNVRARKESKKDEQTSPAKEFVNWYCATYKELKGSPYLRGGKDYGLAADMLKVFSQEEIEKLALKFLKEEDAWVKKAGYTIGVFKTMVNRLVMKKEKGRIGLGNFDKYRPG